MAAMGLLEASATKCVMPKRMPPGPVVLHNVTTKSAEVDSSGRSACESATANARRLESYPHTAVQHHAKPSRSRGATHSLANRALRKLREERAVTLSVCGSATQLESTVPNRNFTPQPQSCTTLPFTPSGDASDDSASTSDDHTSSSSDEAVSLPKLKSSASHKKRNGTTGVNDSDLKAQFQQLLASCLAHTGTSIPPPPASLERLPTDAGNEPSSAVRESGPGVTFSSSHSLRLKNTKTTQQSKTGHSCNHMSSSRSESSSSVTTQPNKAQLWSHPSHGTAQDSALWKKVAYTHGEGREKMLSQEPNLFHSYEKQKSHLRRHKRGQCEVESTKKSHECSVSGDNSDALLLISSGNESKQSSSASVSGEAESKGGTSKCPAKRSTSKQKRVLWKRLKNSYCVQPTVIRAMKKNKSSSCLRSLLLPESVLSDTSDSRLMHQLHLSVVPLPPLIARGQNMEDLLAVDSGLFHRDTASLNHQLTIEPVVALDCLIAPYIAPVCKLPVLIPAPPSLSKLLTQTPSA